VHFPNGSTPDWQAGAITSLSGDAHQSSLTRICQSAHRSLIASCASDNSLGDTLTHVMLFAVRGMLTYPVESDRHVDNYSFVEATFNHGRPRVNCCLNYRQRILGTVIAGLLAQPTNSQFGSPGTNIQLSSLSISRQGQTAICDKRAEIDAKIARHQDADSDAA
jgi:hypothetical protein